MPIALSEDHQELARVARSFLENTGALSKARLGLDAPAEVLPDYWSELGDMGWTSIHLPESYGGQGAGIEELAVILEELGRVLGAAAFLATTTASAVLEACGSEELKTRFLPGLGDASTIGTVGLEGSLTRSGDTLSGTATLVPSAGVATLALLAVGEDLVVVDLTSTGVTVTQASDFDPTRRLCDITLDNVKVEGVLAGARPTALRLLRAFATAEAAGLAHATTEMAVSYAKVREQFGQIIGAFQAVKHHCSNMLVNAELTTALAWEAVQHEGEEGALASAAAVAYGLPATMFCAHKNIQLLGGIGFTWEHDAHLYVKRSQMMATWLKADDHAHEDVVEFSRAGSTTRTVALPPEAEEYRRQARAVADAVKSMSAEETTEELIRTGYFMAHQPPPYGSGAGPIEQIVIEEELGKLADPDLGVGTWVIPTLIQCCNDEQRDRWILQSFRGEYRWCQLFSEPNAGSDAAAIQTRGVKVEGGWMVTGQKVWTSGAQLCNIGLATVRTDPDAPKHAGVTMMAINLKAKGAEVRPLREMSGESMFNEVFLDEVFVPDADVVGEVGGGWNVARATLGNERVTIGGGQRSHTFWSPSLLLVLDTYAQGDVGRTREVGHLLAEAHAMHALHMRNVERAIGGHEPGPEGNITKLLSAEHAQRVTELGFSIAGDAALRGDVEGLIHDVLFVRCLSIAGGTSEISRNQIAERILGLPRDKVK